MSLVCMNERFKNSKKATKKVMSEYEDTDCAIVFHELCVIHDVLC